MDHLKKLTEDEYFVPSQKTDSEIRVKGSRFICTVIPCLEKEDAEREYAEIRKKYYDATHNCFAWRIDEVTFSYSDDGEPSGTAGRPILQAIDACPFQEILCVVTRYFGGTKLGSGGLIRAYGNSTADALAKVRPAKKTLRDVFEIYYDYALENLVRRTLAEFGGLLVRSKYDEAVTMKVALPRSRAKDFCTELSELSNSQIKINDN